MNPEHVAIVRQGMEAIDAWRRAHPGERLDLAEAGLRRANLARADLTVANLAGADLTVANLAGADLTGADLTRANLRRANLAGADLVGTNLNGSLLSFTAFNGADLNQAQFSAARFYYTVFANCDLSVAVSLESVVHDGPSSIGLDTIVRSGGNIPEVFLRGAGVPDSIITYVRSLVQEPIQFYTLFISYASSDRDFAQRLYNDLQGKGVRCWYYPETAVMGRGVWEDIDRAIRVYDKLVVICSEVSLNSPAVLREIERALNKEDSIARGNIQKLNDKTKGEQPRLKDRDVLFLIRIDDYVFNGWQHRRKMDVTGHTIGDFVGCDKDHQKYQRSLDRLLHALDPKSWPAVE
jgi:hypothetical protein